MKATDRTNGSTTGAKIAGRLLFPGAVACLWAVQAAFTLHSRGLIRGEELSESIRNVYWLQHARTVYDSIGSNVGFYGMLALVYEMIGFHIHTAKFVRLAVHLVSLLCLADLLRRTLRPWPAALALVTIGLSPTWLYFNTLQTSYGFDLQMAPICFWLVERVRVGARAALVAGGPLGFLAMFACMCYPTFLPYLPSLALLTLAAWRANAAGRAPAHALPLLTGAAFFAPLLIALLYVKDPWLLIYDERFKAGLFRGGGRLALQSPDFFLNLARVLLDLVYTGDSYYFQLPGVEFSGGLWFPFAGVIFAGIVIFYKKAQFRPVLAAAFLLLLLAFALPALTEFRVPGLRRATGILSAAYVIFACVLKILSDERPAGRGLALVFLSLPLLHHLLVLPANFTAARTPDQWTNRDWFAVAGSPQASLLALEKPGAAGLPLFCPGPDGRPLPGPCRYGEIFGAIAGYRLWNDLDARPVRAFDWHTGEIVELETWHWESYYFPH